MAIVLGAEALAGVLGMRDAIGLLEDMSRHEAAGRTFISPRLNTSFEGGWMRMMFGADFESGYSATKAYHLAQGTGVRYVVSLYRLADGELLAVLDGRQITDLRTGAASGVVARRTPVAGRVQVGIVGSGHQGRMQLESLACAYDIESADVYSPTAANREAFAKDMSARLGFPVRAAATAEAAVRGHAVVVAATSSRSGDPVILNAWLDGCRLLCAVGSTRPESVEVDPDAFRDSSLTVVDSARAAEEAGDLQQAEKRGYVPHDRQATLAQIVAGQKAVPATGRVVFKSVGSALQDLALAGRYYELLRGHTGLPGANDLASLKRPVSAAGITGR